MEKEKLTALVLAAQQGDQEAVAALYEAFQSDIYYHILKNVNNDTELAADLTQDTFIEIMQTLSDLKEPAAFVTWSQRIAYHKCTAYFRKRHELLVDETEDGYSVFDTIEEDRSEFIPGEALEKEEFRRAIQKMIDELPPEQRSAILLRYFNELPVQEIAKIQGVSEGTVKSRLNYGRKTIKSGVEKYEKNNGIQVRSSSVVSLLLWLLREYKKENGVPLSEQISPEKMATFLDAAGTAAEIAGETVSETTSEVATEMATEVTKKAVSSAAKKTATSAVGKFFTKRVIAIAAAATLTAGGATVAVTMQPENEPQPTEQVMQLEVAPAEAFSYEVMDDGSCRIVGYSGDAGEAFAIPDMLEGCPVTAIGREAFAESKIVSLALPESVTTIGDGAFENCSALKNIQFGSRLTHIGGYAFSGCVSLTEAELPNSVQTMGRGIFYNCEKLSRVTYPASLLCVEYAWNCGIFVGCKSLKAIEVPEGVTTLPEYIFYDAKYLQSVSLPSTLVTIEREAFVNCVSLKEVSIPESVMEIGADAFKGATKVTFVCAPDSYAAEYAQKYQISVKPEE